MRRDIQNFADAAFAFLTLLAGRNQALLGAAAPFPAFGERGERRRRLVIGLALDAFGLGQEVAGVTARLLGLLQFGKQSPALVVEFIRRQFELGCLFARLFLAFTQRGDMASPSTRSMTMAGLPSSSPVGSNQRGTGIGTWPDA